jgi:NADPH-dependent curcumin reductase
MTDLCRSIVLARRPAGKASKDDFALTEHAIPAPAAGEVLTRTLWLSIDPYMRGRMDNAPSYAPPINLGEPMIGETIGEVIESGHPDFRPGQIVSGAYGWSTHLVTPAAQLTKLRPGAPWQAHLGVLGMPGATAYVGLRDIARLRPGETIVVSAAAGAVGSVAVQLAKRAGARVVGVAGGATKCRRVTEELGADACIDYRSHADLKTALGAACPDGVDVYFENVGGTLQQAVFPLLNDFGRVVMCGMVAEYDDHTPANELRPDVPPANAPPARAARPNTPQPGTPRPGPNLMDVVRKRLRIQGFIILDQPGDRAEWRQLATKLIATGQLLYREQIVTGLENAPAALIALVNATNEAKIVVRVADPIHTHVAT